MSFNLAKIIDFVCERLENVMKKHRLPTISCFHKLSSSGPLTLYHIMLTFNDLEIKNLLKTLSKHW